jgi:hypothetical protein
MSLTKKNIADLLAEQVGISQTQALSITNDFFDVIRDSLAEGEDVKLSGLYVCVNTDNWQNSILTKVFIYLTLLFL